MSRLYYYFRFRPLLSLFLMAVVTVGLINAAIIIQKNKFPHSENDVETAINAEVIAELPTETELETNDAIFQTIELPEEKMIVTNLVSKENNATPMALAVEEVVPDGTVDGEMESSSIADQAPELDSIDLTNDVPIAAPPVVDQESLVEKDFFFDIESVEKTVSDQVTAIEPIDAEKMDEEPTLELTENVTAPTEIISEMEETDSIPDQIVFNKMDDAETNRDETVTIQIDEAREENHNEESDVDFFDVVVAKTESFEAEPIELGSDANDFNWKVVDEGQNQYATPKIESKVADFYAQDDEITQTEKTPDKVIHDDAENSSDVAPVEAPVVEALVAETPVPETDPVENLVTEAPVPETDPVETPVAEAPVPETDPVENLVTEAPVPETDPVEAPVAETPVLKTDPVETPIAETPVLKTDPVETPVTEAPVLKTDPVETPVAEAPVLKTDPVETPVAEAPVLKTDPVETPVAEAPVPESLVTKMTPAATTVSNEIWVVSSENIQKIGVGASALNYWKAEKGQFQPSSAEQFLATQTPAAATVILIHGNMTDWEVAMEHTVIFKSRLEQIQKSQGISTPFRLIIWKWASERQYKRIRTDSQAKAYLADLNGFYLASLLSALNSENNITMVGFSFGARTIGSAMTLLSGSSALNYTLPPEMIAGTDHNRYNAVLLAGACNYGDFGTGGQYANGSHLLSSMINVFNPTDQALQFYPLLYGAGGPDALGIAPIQPATVPVSLQKRLWSINSSINGPKHHFSNLLYSINPKLLGNVIFDKTSVAN